MIKWIHRLFGICQHKWVIIKQHDVRVCGFSETDYLYTEKIYTLQCDKCGDIKQKVTR